MMKLIVRFFELGKKALAEGASVTAVTGSGWCEKLIKMKYDIPNDDPGMFDSYTSDMERELTVLTGGAAVGA